MDWIFTAVRLGYLLALIITSVKRKNNGLPVYKHILIWLTAGYIPLCAMDSCAVIQEMFGSFEPAANDAEGFGTVLNLMVYPMIYAFGLIVIAVIFGVGAVVLITLWIIYAVRRSKKND